MKKIFNILIITLVLSACSDDLLDVKNENQYDGNTFFADANSYIQASTAMYTPLLHTGMYSRDFYFIFDLLGNDAEKNTPLQGALLEYPNYTHTPNNGTLNSLWSACYRMNQRALFVIDAVDKWETGVESEVNLKARLKGEAYFMRALSSFWLVTLWGDVPLRENIQNLDVQMPRRPAAEIWQTIEGDLSMAIERLPVAHPASDLGRATKGAAIALLGKSYLYQKKYAQAIEQFKKLTEAPFDYVLEGDLDDLFIYDKSDSKEVVFAVMHGDWQGWGVGNAYYMFGGSETWGGAATHTGRAMEYGFNDWHNVIVSNALANSYKYNDEGGNAYTDPRAAKVFYGTPQSGGDTQFCNDCEGGPKPYERNQNNWRKYQYYEFEEIHGVPQSSINSQVIRYADVLLMLAESYIETNQVELALPLINQVRSRSGAFEFSTLGGQANAITILRRERQMELAGEQVRFFDLVRWGVLAETINAEKASAINITPVRDFHSKLPIPQLEIDANPKLKDQVNNSWN